MTIGKDFYDLSSTPIRSDQVNYTGENTGAYLPYSKMVAASGGNGAVLTFTGTTPKSCFDVTPSYLYSGLTWQSGTFNSVVGKRITIPDSLFNGANTVRLRIFGNINGNISLNTFTVRVYGIARSVSGAGFTDFVSSNEVDANDLVLSSFGPWEVQIEYQIQPSSTPGSYVISGLPSGSYYNANSIETRSFFAPTASGDIITSKDPLLPLYIMPVCFWSGASGSNVGAITKTTIEFV